MVRPSSVKGFMLVILPFDVLKRTFVLAIRESWTTDYAAGAFGYGAT
jgi:hypothetical protein